MFETLTISAILTFLVLLLLAGCVIMAVNWFIGLLGIPQPIKTIVLIVLGIIGLVWLLQFIGVATIPL